MDISPICSSILCDMPLNLVGGGPIIWTSWGTSWEEIWQNLASALRVRNTCSSGGELLKNCSTAIDNSTATSSNTCQQWTQSHFSAGQQSQPYFQLQRHTVQHLLPPADDSITNRQMNSKHLHTYWKDYRNVVQHQPPTDTHSFSRRTIIDKYFHSYRQVNLHVL